MEESRANLKANYNTLESILGQLVTSLSEHSRRLEAHALTMENLDKDIQQLQRIMAKEFRLAPHQPSLQLKQAFTNFMDYHINPLCYRKHSDRQLIGVRPPKHPQYTHKKEAL